MQAQPIWNESQRKPTVLGVRIFEGSGTSPQVRVDAASTNKARKVGQSLVSLNWKRNPATTAMDERARNQAGWSGVTRIQGFPHTFGGMYVPVPRPPTRPSRVDPHTRLLRSRDPLFKPRNSPLASQHVGQLNPQPTLT